jgi:hypothetical protein
MRDRPKRPGAAFARRLVRPRAAPRTADAVVEPARRPRLVVQHLMWQHPRRAAEWQLARQQLVEDDAEAVDVGRVQAFLNEVDAFVQADILTPAQADPLLGAGNVLLTGLSRR